MMVAAYTNEHDYMHMHMHICNKVLAADEGLHGRNVLFINFSQCPLLKVSLTSI